MDGECDDTTAADAAATGRRQLAGSDSCDSPGGGSSRWCRYCVDVDGAEVCDTTPVIGHKYWQVGEDCAKHEAECDCEMMMPASAFSICVRCLAAASYLDGYLTVLPTVVCPPSTSRFPKASQKRALCAHLTALVPCLTGWRLLLLRRCGRS